MKTSRDEEFCGLISIAISIWISILKSACPHGAVFQAMVMAYLPECKSRL
jgi:hypothetical protein